MIVEFVYTNNLEPSVENLLFSDSSYEEAEMTDETFNGLEASINDVLGKVMEQNEVNKSLSKKIDGVVSTITKMVESVAANLSSLAQSITALCSLKAQGVSTSNMVNILVYRNRIDIFKKSFQKNGRFLMKNCFSMLTKTYFLTICDKGKRDKITYGNLFLCISKKIIKF